MNQRLPLNNREWIDRDRLVRFRFENIEYTGFAGDTISSALWANGVRILGRSFKYHRPRGIFSLADWDCNCLVETDDAVNIRADIALAANGASYTAVNTFGGLSRDRGRWFDKLSVFLPVGFYYKAFHTPARFFPWYEKRIRRMAGLGHINPDIRFKRSPKSYDFCDVLVVGAGRAGLAAAKAAAAHGLRVLVVEEQPRAADTIPAEFPNLELRTLTCAAAYYADHWVALVDNLRLTKLRARAVIFATGCMEQPAVFRNNDLPGVMLGSAAAKLIERYRVLPFHRAVVLTANAEGYRIALELVRAGAEVRAIVDLRSDGHESQLQALAEEQRIPVLRGSYISEAVAGPGGVLHRVVVQTDGRAVEFDCDGLLMSVGWAPADSLLRQAGVEMTYRKSHEQYLPDILPPGIFAAGGVNGIYGAESEADGQRAGLEAATCLGVAIPFVRKGQAREQASCVNHPYPIVEHPGGKNFVDLDEDLQLHDIVNSIAEGFETPELLKRYATLGMGPSQGKHANMNALRIIARSRGKDLAETSMTTARPFTSPVPLGHLAGRIFSPIRRTPLEMFHREAGASLFLTSGWLRPEYYQREGMSRSETIAAEVKSVRDAAGLIDISTLGKLEVAGPDAVRFLESIYTVRLAKLPVGATRYVLMTDEAGVLIDDGVAARLADDRFYVTTTTGGSDSVAREMRRWALIWGMQVTISNLTGTLAALNLAGPQSRNILAGLDGGTLGLTGFPFLGVREGVVADASVRAVRVGFVGELGYEIDVPADAALHVWKQIILAGQPFGIRPFGVEAQRILRLEKGHLIIGHDTDGLTNPFEAGMDWAVKMDKPFFVGQRSLKVLKQRPLARRLVGFALPAGYSGPVPMECHLVIKDGQIAGRVTSISPSPTLNRWIGLVYLPDGQSQIGSCFHIRVDSGALVSAEVVPLPFYDPDNARQKESD